MSTPLLVLAGVLVLGLVTMVVVIVVGMRTKSPLVVGPLIRLQRVFINPRQMRSAGTPGAYAAIIRHRGRTSGRIYETPVGVEEADGAFVIALPYGPRTSWLRNVVAQGSATIVHDGHTYAVERPEILPIAGVLEHFTIGDRRSARLLGTDLALRLHRVEPMASADRSAETTDADAAPAVAVVRGMPG